MTQTGIASTGRLQIQFSHGNGFPAGTYRSFLAALEPECQIHAIERIGHDARYPITNGWPYLLDELLAQLDTATEPRILLGHSLGGILSLMAAYARPEKVRAVVMLDSPIFARWKAWLFQFAKITGLDERFSPAALTKNRRISWPSRQAAVAHFSGKALFKEFDAQVLNDYAAYGMVDSSQGAGVELAFAREHEYRIYRTVPHHLYQLVAQPAPVPCGFIAGTRSAELTLVGAADSRRFVGENFCWFEGTHLFPMERPRRAAQTVRALLLSMGVV